MPPEIRDGELDGPTVLSLAREQSHTLAGMTLQQLERFAAVTANNTSLMSTIEFERFDGDVVFVSASHRGRGPAPAHMNPQKWQPHCAGIIEMLAIDSTHNRMLTAESLSQVRFLGDPSMGRSQRVGPLVAREVIVYDRR